jgi:quinol monooxygenase YgiN
VLPGRDGDFNALMAEMIKITRDREPGTLNYEWSTSADGRVCHIFERYVNSSAAIKHLESFKSNFAERFLAILKPTRFVVYGAPSQAVQEALVGFSPMYMRSANGFARQA